MVLRGHNMFFYVSMFSKANSSKSNLNDAPPEGFLSNEPVRARG